MPDPAEDVPTDGPGGQSDRRLHLGALGLGVPWAIRIGAVIELADEFDWAFKGVEMAIAMIADMHHAPARGAIPIQHVKFPESEVGVGWPAVGHRIDLRGVPVGLHVLLSAEQKDTKQPCSVLASFLAVAKIPYGGFSPVRLQMDRQWRPSTTSQGLSAVHPYPGSPE